MKIFGLDIIKVALPALSSDVAHKYFFLAKQPQIRFDTMKSLRLFSERRILPKSAFVTDELRNTRLNGVGITRAEYERMYGTLPRAGMYEGIVHPSKPPKLQIKTPSLGARSPSFLSKPKSPSTPSTPSTPPRSSASPRRISSDSRSPNRKDTYPREDKVDDEGKRVANAWFSSHVATGASAAPVLVLDDFKAQNTVKALLAKGVRNIHVVEREISEAQAKALSTKDVTWHAGELRDFMDSTELIFSAIYVDGMNSWDKTWLDARTAVQDRLVRDGAPVFGVTFAKRGGFKHAVSFARKDMSVFLSMYYDVVDRAEIKGGTVHTLLFRLRRKM